MITTNYYCPACRREIDVLVAKPGILSRCPHCGVSLRGLNAARKNKTTELMFPPVFLALFFLVMSVFFPPALFFAVGMGTWAYFVHRKSKAPPGTDKRGGPVPGPAGVTPLAEWHPGSFLNQPGPRPRRRVAPRAKVVPGPVPSQARFCTGCGTPAAPGGVFCVKCGKRL